MSTDGTQDHPVLRLLDQARLAAAKGGRPVSVRRFGQLMAKPYGQRLPSSTIHGYFTDPDSTPWPLVIAILREFPELSFDAAVRDQDDSLEARVREMEVFLIELQDEVDEARAQIGLPGLKRRLRLPDSAKVAYSP